VPLWAKTAIDGWSSAAGISEGRIFRAIRIADPVGSKVGGRATFA